MKPIQIVGGGLAGLTLGIALRQAGAPVTVMEAGSYPRHRVCGEFISGRGRTILRDLGLDQTLHACGAREARTAAFYSRRVASRPRQLPQPALSISRYALDHLLAQEFRRLGGNLAENKRWPGPFTEGVVRATGRTPVASTSGWRWFGLKVHVRHAQVEADLEMHLLQDAYVGLCRLNDDTVNVCGLFRRRAPLPSLAKDWRELLDGPPDSVLRQRLAGASCIEGSFCATAGLRLDPQRAAARPECCLGDAITMIAPLTGNGMSMAFESAALARDPLLSYSRGQINWNSARQRIARACDAAFRQRLFWGRRLQDAVFRNRLSDCAVWLSGRCPLLWRQLFSRTR